VLPPSETGVAISHRPPILRKRVTALAQLATLSNRSRRRGSTITNADKKDLCKLVIHALTKIPYFFLINTPFNEAFSAVKWVSDLGDGELTDRPGACSVRLALQGENFSGSRGTCHALRSLLATGTYLSHLP
jgi:hypothetical protein